MFGFCPRNIRLFLQACRHRSAVRDGKKEGDNERLEFLGDAVLGTIVADIVFSAYNAQREGFLTNTRAKIVQRETLNRIAVELGIDKIVQAHSPSTSHNNYMYGNALEALVGAIYIDQGYDRCRRIVEERILKPFIDLQQIASREVNFKSSLIEWCQHRHIPYDFVIDKASYDENNNPVFHSAVLLAQVPAGEGMGYSKKEAHQQAASMALKRLRRDAGFVALIRSSARSLAATPVAE